MKPEYEHLLSKLIAKAARQFVTQEGLTNQIIMRAKCLEFSQAFVDAFPQLCLQSGFYGNTEHWWCVEPDGEIVDPTKEQFSNQNLAYREFDESKEEVRIGRCMNCGDKIYGLISRGHQSICSPECEREFEEYLNEERIKFSSQKNLEIA